MPNHLFHVYNLVGFRIFSTPLEYSAHQWRGVKENQRLCAIPINALLYFRPTLGTCLSLSVKPAKYYDIPFCYICFRRHSPGVILASYTTDRWMLFSDMTWRYCGSILRSRPYLRVSPRSQQYSSVLHIDKGHCSNLIRTLTP